MWTSTDSRFRSANRRVFCSSRGLEEWKRAGCPSPKKNMNQQQQLSVSIFSPINENCSTRSAPVPFSYSSASVYSLTSVCKKKLQVEMGTVLKLSFNLTLASYIIIMVCNQLQVWFQNSILQPRIERNAIQVPEAFMTTVITSLRIHRLVSNLKFV